MLMKLTVALTIVLSLSCATCSSDIDKAKLTRIDPTYIEHPDCFSSEENGRDWIFRGEASDWTRFYRCRRYQAWELSLIHI